MNDRARETSDLLLTGLPLVGLLCTLGWAGPDDPQVIRGSASFQRSGNFTTITVTDNAIINYRQFNIAGSETVRFIQPGVDARVLNRITGAMPTRIDGTLLANGRVYLVNPSGVFFGKNSTVNVGTLIAAAGHMSNRDFLGGVTRFTHMQGEVRNEGIIRAGEVVLAGNSVVNIGSIVAPEGMVALVAGDEVFLGREGSKMYAHITSTPRVSPATGGVRNEGKIDARGGRAVLAAGDLFSLALGTGSSITASSVQIQGGRAATLSVSGSIDASSSLPGTRGGEIEITGRHVGLSNAQIEASGPAGGGEVLVGGDYLGKGDTPTASAVFVDAGSVIRADALQAGDGGKVIIFAEGATRVYGTLSARGGSQGGDGGLIETSGKGFLDVSGVPDASAPNGQGGWWVLDPFNITITNDTAGNGSLDGDTPDFVAGADDSTISNAQIDLALDAGTSVLVSTNDGASGTQAGNITQDSDAPITKSAGGNASIEFRSFDGVGDGTGGLITLSGGIVNTSGNELNVVIKADAIEFTGGLLESSVIIDTNPFTLGSGDLTVNAASLQLDVDITGGDFVFNTPVTLSANMTSQSATFGDTVTVTGANRTVTTSGASTFAAIAADGSARTLAINTNGLTTLGGTINDSDLRITTNGAGSTTISSGITAAGVLLFNDDVTLSADTASGSVTFGDTLTVTGANRTVTASSDASFSVIETDGLARTLIIDSAGVIFLDGTINDSDLSLTINGTGSTTITNDITAAGTLIFNDEVFLSANITSQSATFANTLRVADTNRTVTTTGASTFAAIAADGSARLLTINTDGLTTLGGAINDSDLSLTTNSAGTTTITGGITNAATLLFNDPVALNSNVSATTATFGDTLTVTGGDRIVTTTGASTFAPIAADGSARTLTINTNGLTTLGGAINDSDLSLTTNSAGTTTITGVIADAAVLTFNDAVTLSANIASQSATFGDTVTVTGANRTVTTTGASTFAAIAADGSARLLTINTNGVTTLGGTINDNDLSLTTNSVGTTTITGGITNAATLLFNDAVTLSSNTSSQSVTFTDSLTVTGADRTVATTGDSTFSVIAADGSPRTLAINTDGLTTLGGAINDSDLSLTTNSAGTTTISGGITAAEALVFNDNVTLSANISGASVAFNEDVTTTGSRAVTSQTTLAFGNLGDDLLTLGGDLTAAADTASGGAVLDFYNITGGGNTLTANNAAGATNFNAASGVGVTNLGLTTDVGSGVTTIGQAITNSQALVFNDDVNLDADISAASVAFNEDVTTTGSRAVTSQTTLAFGNASDDLLTLGGGLIATADTANGGVALNFFNITGDGNTLVANNAAGATNFNAASGVGVTNLGLTTDVGSGVTTIGQAITNGLTLLFNDPVTLAADVTSAAATFNSTLTVTGANRTVTTSAASTFAAIVADGSSRTLSINTDGLTTLGGTINDNDLSLTTNSAGTTTISGGITNSGALVFNDVVSLNADVTASTVVFNNPVSLAADVTATAATFGDMLTVTGANRAVTTTGASTFAAIAADGSARLLTINTNGLTTLGGAINDSDLSLTTNSAGTTTITRDITSGALTFNDPVTISGIGERVLQAADSGGVVFGSTLTLNSTVTGLRIRADEIGFGGSVTPAGGANHALKLEPGTVDIVLNGTVSPGQLDLTQAELDFIQSGFNGVTIGRSDSTSDIRVAAGGVTFTNFDTALLAGPGQDITLNGDINTNGNNLTVATGNNGRFRLGADINTSGGNVDLTAATDIDLIADSVLDTDATGGTSDAGDITFSQAGTIDGAFDLSLRADADNGGAGGTVVVAQVGTDAALDDLTIRGAAITLPNIGAGTTAGVDGSTDIASTGAMTFSGTLYLTNDAKYTASSFAVNGTAGQTTRFGSTGDAVSFESAGSGNGDLTLAENVDLAIDTGSGGNVLIEGPIDGTAGGVGEGVSITAGTGTVQLLSDLGSTVPLGSLNSTAATTQLGGSIQTAVGSDITITGDLQIREAQAVTLSTGTDGDIVVTGAIFGTETGSAETLTLAPGSSSTLGGGVFGISNGTASSTGLTTLTTNATTNLNGNIALTGGAFTSNGPLLVASTASRISTGTGTLTLADSTQFAAAMILEATEIDLGGGAGSVTGSGSLTLIPTLDSAAINVGSAAGAGAGSLDLSGSDLAALADGFASITIGRTNGTHAVAIGDATFRDPLTIRAPGTGGTIALSGRLLGTGDAGFTFNETGSPFAFLAGTDVGITTQGGGIAIADAVAFAGETAFTLLSAGGDTSVDGGVSLGNGSTASFTSGGGAVTLASGGSGLDGAGVLSVNAGTGPVTLGAPVGASTPLNRLTITGGVLTLPSTINTTGTQSYTGTTSAQGTYTSSAGGIEFNDQLNLVNDLTLEAADGVSIAASVDDASGQSAPNERSNLTIDGNTTGAVTFASTVGANTPIGTLTVRDATSLSAAGAVNAENIVTTGIAGNAAFGAITTDGTPGSVGTFAIDLDADSFDLPGPFTTETGTGMRLDLGTSSGLVVLGSSASTWDGLGGDLVQLGENGIVQLGTNIIRSNGDPIAGDVTLNSKLELDANDRVISAQNVNILGGFRTADGQGGVAGLTLRSTGDNNRTTLRGLDGSLTDPGLNTLINALTLEGRSTLSGPIGTTNGMDFGGQVTIGNDAPTTLQVVNKGDIIFQGDILGSGAASSLSIQLDPSQTANTVEDAFNNDAEAYESDNAFPIIEFGGNVGTNDNRLGSLTLNGTPHTTTPALPTIISRSDVEFFLENNFTMGVGEKFTVLGNLTLNTRDGVVTLSDLAVAGDLTIAGASGIVLQNRGGAPLIGYSNPPVIRGLGDDQSGDIVLLGTLVVDDGTSVSVSGDPGFNIATPSGAGLGAFNVPGVVIRQFGTEPGSLTIDEFGVVAGDVPGIPDETFPDLLLDLRADGPVVQDVSGALAGAIPRDPESGQVTQETRLSAAQLEKLLKLGINAVDRDGIRLSEGGPRVYNDAGAVTEMHQVSVNRMSSNAVDRVLDRFDSLFYRGEGAERIYDQNLPKRQIESAILPYFEANDEAPFIAEVIWDYLVTGTPEQLEAARSLYEVKMLLEDIGRLGLTNAEAALPRNRIIANLRSQNVFESTEEVATLVAIAQPISTVTPTPTPSPAPAQDDPKPSSPETPQQP